MSLTRRGFIASIVASTTSLFLADSLWFEKSFIETNEFFLGDKKASPPIKAVQVSDLHLKEITYSIRRLATKLNTISPDLILFTGDAIDRAENVELLDEFLQLINHDTKKVVILGNWEYWGHVDIRQLRKVYEKNNCDLLVNESRLYQVGVRTVSITGVDDFVGGGADIEKALQTFTNADHHIILNHCPEYSDEIAALTPNDVPVDVILSGHTHGGQINLFGFIPFLPQGSGQYVKGWYRDQSKNLYVSKGIGTSKVAMRFMARAEIAIFNLHG